MHGTSQINAWELLTKFEFFCRYIVIFRKEQISIIFTRNKHIIRLFPFGFPLISIKYPPNTDNSLSILLSNFVISQGTSMSVWFSLITLFCKYHARVPQRLTHFEQENRVNNARPYPFVHNIRNVRIMHRDEKLTDETVNLLCC